MKMEDYDSLKKRIAQEGDPKAFKTFFYFYYKRLFSYSMRMLKSEELSEEVVSDVFIKLWHHRQKLQEIQNIDTYLYKAVRNKCLNKIKQNLAKGNKHLSLDDTTLDLLVENYTPEKKYFADELQNFVNNVVKNLPIACKNAFLMVKEDGLSYKEAGEILEISPLTVKKQTLKAVKKIREKLSERESREFDRLKNISSITLFLMFFAKNLIFFKNSVLP